jgi:hypothetical protein
MAGLLAERLSGSELNSLMLAVYARRTERMDPAELLAQYHGNRLVQPTDVDMIWALEAELSMLRFYQERGFKAMGLSPVAVLGTCSVVAPVSQDKVISAIRNTEIVADATNCLALHIADRRKEGEAGPMKFCTVHRHVRTQPFTDARLRPHFVIGCAVSAGRDTGNYGFECGALSEQVCLMIGLLEGEFGIRRFRLVLKRRGGYDEGSPLIDVVERTLRERLGEGAGSGDGTEGGRGVVIEREDEPAANHYYLGVQFKLYIGTENGEWEIADGGFVDWTQRLLGNRKERMLISGIGLELLYRMKTGLV